MIQPTMTDRYEFHDKVGEVPVGSLYEAVTDTETGESVRVGDMATFDDPDLGHRDADRGIHSRLFVGKIEKIYDFRDENDPEIGTTMPVGRLPAFGDSHVNVSGEGIRPDDGSAVEKFIEQLLTKMEEDDSDVSSLTMEWGNDGHERTWR